MIGDRLYGNVSLAQRAFQEVTKLLDEQTGQKGQGIIHGLLENSGQGQV
ncbi:MAG TPA: hypothetical protein VFU67_05945 [Nitrososphaeraceae archaeon]|nr:hypothetical protein [Nitrososphaeraceae archaeon]